MSDNIEKNLKKKFLAYLISARTPTYITVSVFFLLGEWIASKSFPFYHTIIVLVFLLCVQFVNGLTNMAFDKKLDIFARKNIMWVFSYISSKEMLFSSAVFSVIGLIILYPLGFNVILMGLFLIALTILYAAPPFRFKTKPPLDTIVNMHLFATVPFYIGWLTTANILDLNSVLYGLVLGLSSITYYLLFSWQDIKTDSNFGINTTCTKLGYKWTIYVSLIIWIVLIFLSVYYFYFDILTISFIIVFPILFSIFIIDNKVNNYRVKLKSIGFFIGIASSLWMIFILASMSVLSVNIFPIFFLIILVVYIIFNVKIYSLIGKKIFTSLKNS
jgi:4-hydroxybenzoate polyprenyltransferase